MSETTQRRKKIIIHLDINGTCVAIDPSSELSAEGVVGINLASFIQKQPQTNLHFFRLFGGPSDVQDQKLVSFYTEMENILLGHRISLQKSLSKGVGSEFEYIRKKLLSFVSNEKEELPSLIRLFEWLTNSQQIGFDWVVVFRTFGNDLAWILPRIQHLFKDKLSSIETNPAIITRNPNGQIELASPNKVKIIGQENIANWIEDHQNKSVFGIEDDYDFWAVQSNHSAESGKTVWVRNGNGDRSNITHIIFDDNARIGDSNTAIDLEIEDEEEIGRFVPSFTSKTGWKNEISKHYAEVAIIPARILEAATNSDYFIDHILMRIESQKSQTSLFLRTSTIEESIQCRKSNSLSWAEGITVDRYLEREIALGKQDFSWNSEQICWILSDTPWHFQQNHSKIFSSCETYRFLSITNGEIGHCYAIASVYTVPELRGKGFAAILISKLVEKLKKCDPLSQAVILYSDVGTYYNRCGFKEATSNPEIITFDSIEDNHLDASFIKKSSKEAFKEFEAAKSIFISTSTSEFTILPSFDKLGWYEVRDKFYCPLSLELNENLPCGAKCNYSWVFWSPNHKEGFLDIHLIVGNEEGLTECIKAARKCASMVNLKSVRVWKDETMNNVEKLKWFKENYGKCLPRGCSIPMICSLNKNVPPTSWKLIPHLFWV